MMQLVNGQHAWVWARGRHFEHFVIINLFSLKDLMNFIFHTMLDAARDVLRAHNYSTKYYV